MPVPDRDLAARPTECPHGHQLDPGRYSLSFEWCGDPCGQPGNGHHWLICGTCGARLWLGHGGAEWQT